MNKTVELKQVFDIIIEQLESGGTASFITKGTSMLPLLDDGKDTVWIKKPENSPKKYDMVFYRRNDGAFILHRVVGIGKDGYICRGDNQIDNEYPIIESRIIATVFRYKRKGKTVSVDSLSHKIYSILWVNTVFIRRLKRKIFSALIKTFKKQQPR